MEMGIKALSSAEVRIRMVRNLGLDPSAFELTSIEALAAALRRAAGFHCPCSPATLVRTVLGPLEGLVDDVTSIKEAAESTLEAITGYGDLLESRDDASGDGEKGRNLLYIAPPAFVMRASGAALLVGIVPERTSLLPDDLDALVEYASHVRRLPAGIDDLRTRLIELGLVEMLSAAWLKAPPLESPQAHLARLNSYLATASSTVDIPGLRLIDPSAPVRYYPGRWVEKLKATGHFVGRRPQAYGADLWCYIELENGSPRRFLDLPLPKSRARGCDEAWQLQAAIDAERGEPQRYRLRPGDQGSKVLDIFSPVPMWARRRWDALGEPLQGSGCLFSYRFREGDIEEETKFARENLWLNEMPGQ